MRRKGQRCGTVDGTGNNHPHHQQKTESDSYSSIKRSAVILLCTPRKSLKIMLFHQHFTKMRISLQNETLAGNLVFTMQQVETTVPPVSIVSIIL